MSKQPKHFYEFGPFRLDPAERLLTQEGKPVQLTDKVFDLLLLLVRRAGRLVEKEEIFREVWPDRQVDDSNLTVNVSTLRRALGEGNGGAKYIGTVPRRGYRFVADVREVGEEEPPAAEAEARNSTSPPTAPATAGDVALEGEAPPAAEPGSDPPREENGAAPRPSWITVRGLTVPISGLLLLALTAAISILWFRGDGADAGRQELRIIAVLPFRHINGGDADESLELGMADALIAKLGRLRRITVRPTRAVLKYTGQTTDPRAAGRELGVDAVLDGTVQRSGDRVRVTVQLISVHDGKHLWSGTFNEPWSDIFTVQDAISNEVARSLSLQVTKEERELLAKRYTENTGAYEEYQRGRYFWNKRTPEGFRKAIEYFREATDQDPNYALAYTGLADSYILLAIFGDQPPGETIPKAKEATLKALELNDTLAEGHTSLAAIKWWYEHDLPGAEQDFKRAVELNPNYATAHHWYALYLSERGRHEDALREISLAQQLDPMSTVISSDVALILHEAGRYDQAIEQYRKTLELDPGDLLARRQLGNVYITRGMYAEAIAEYQKVVDISGEDPINLVALGAAYARSGQQQQALMVVDRLKELSGRRYVPPFYIASIYVALGDTDEAFKWIEMVFREGGRFVDYMRKDFESLQSDPRWGELERRYHHPKSAD